MIPGHQMLVEKLNEDGFDRQYIFKKYANKKFLKAAVFALGWARVHAGDGASGEQMIVEN
jgi:G2/mitotic-specific cyclin 2